MLFLVERDSHGEIGMIGADGECRSREHGGTLIGLDAKTQVVRRDALAGRSHRLGGATDASGASRNS